MSNVIRLMRVPEDPRPATWMEQMRSLERGRSSESRYGQPERWPDGMEVLYVIDVPATLLGQGLVVEVSQRAPKKTGGWSKPKPLRAEQRRIALLPNPIDRQVVSVLCGLASQPEYRSHSYGYQQPSRFTVSSDALETILTMICETGRCVLRLAPPNGALRGLRFDPEGPWEFWLRADRDDAARTYTITGEFRRDDARMPLGVPDLLIKGGMVFHGGQVSRLRDFGAFDWIFMLRKAHALTVPVDDGDEWLRGALKTSALPPMDLPDGLRFERTKITPTPIVKIKKRAQRYYYDRDLLRADIAFDYRGNVLPENDGRVGIFDWSGRRLLARDVDFENAALARISQVGVKRVQCYGEVEWQLVPTRLPAVVRTLAAEGWQVEAEGKLFRRPGAIRIDVASGIDWFELRGSVAYGESAAKLPDILKAVARGEESVRLDDGTFGMLPVEWLKKYGAVAGLGTAEDDHVRFSKCQVGFLDALLASQPEASCDAQFAAARDELRRFTGVRSVEAPSGFCGTLREYQREGLGWLAFLRTFGFGGCLADDMGLGKTVQVLALLESRRAEQGSNGNGKSHAPSLVVVPRSLIFNWKQEAARFAPNLRLLDHTGMTRQKSAEHFGAHDVVLTTYGTLRRDIVLLKDVRFDTCVLDEAQAVKNSDTESAKAVRLLQADHRLALSGTPVENHIGELWSLFEFLNPGMLGTASVFEKLGGGARNPDVEARVPLARALRPFILRRTKSQVAKDLPDKTEQTLQCEFDEKARKEYDALREHYRTSLLSRIDAVGMNNAKIQILEALLRLRQMACHPGLIDKTRVGESSAKLETIVSQVSQVIDEGHKVLVFSQFTSFLAIVRARLNAAGIEHEYLDGKTRDREARVERFQNDAACRLFLVSLKAGGLGLNLTAAEYVFLLDPWWNPAVEAQAIDRAHRIGQTRSVFAYRLVTRDTIEDKILALQTQKRNLADAIISADNSTMRDLSRDDLAMLLS